MTHYSYESASFRIGALNVDASDVRFGYQREPIETAEPLLRGRGTYSASVDIKMTRLDWMKLQRSFGLMSRRTLKPKRWSCPWLLGRISG